MAAGWIRVLVSCAFVAATLAIALFLFSFDSDGAFAVNDGIWYGLGAERFPAESIFPTHLLFNVLAIGLVPVLRFVGVDHPGHAAVRVVAALGCVWLLLQIMALAGRRRVLVGALFALVMLAMRGTILETAAGENVIPAAAAALFALVLASRARPSLAPVGAALTLALVLREDNILIVPGVAVAVAMSLPRGSRLAGVTKVLAASGLVTVLCYVVGWMVATGGLRPFDHWLSPYGMQPWAGDGLTASSFSAYATSIALAATGELWPVGETHPWTGLGVVALIAVAGVLLRGSGANLRLWIPFALALTGRALFHAWFEPHNFEWLMLPVALVISFAAGLAHGSPATGALSRSVGVVLLLGLAAWMLVAHAPSTWRLRGRVYMSAIDEAAGPHPGDWRFLAHGMRASTGLALLGVPFVTILETPDQTLETVTTQARTNLAPTVVILADRLVNTGMPYDVDHRSSRRMPFDSEPDTPTIQYIRREGMICAMRVVPAGKATRAPGR